MGLNKCTLSQDSKSFKDFSSFYIIILLRVKLGFFKGNLCAHSCLF